MEFKDYQKYFKIEKLEKPIIKTKKYIAKLTLASAKIEDFDQKYVDGRIFNNKKYQGKNFDYISDIKSVIEDNEVKIKKKANAKFEFLDIGNLSIIIGLEIDEEYNNNRISRFLGNFLSRPLFHDKQWFLLVNNKSHLFNIDIKEYTD